MTMEDVATLVFVRIVKWVSFRSALECLRVDRILRILKPLKFVGFPSWGKWYVSILLKGFSSLMLMGRLGVKWGWWAWCFEIVMGLAWLVL